jgi:thiamine-monophosphate kinase
VGDDAALVEPGHGAVLLTTDLLVEGVHFELSMAPRDLGYKALVANISDVAAMAGSPRYALVSTVLSEAVGPPWVIELYGGMLEACKEHACAIVGGDLSRGREVVVSVTITGEVSHRDVVSRTGARPGDRIVVTGWLGGAAGGLALGRAGDDVVRRAAGTDWERELSLALDRPVARVGEGQTLAQCGATAMMDVSDGLALDLTRLCAASSVGARVRLDDVPVHPALRHLAGMLPGHDPLELALSGGEDYELLATIPEDRVTEAMELLNGRYGTRLHGIGEVAATQEVVAVGADGAERPLEPKGWDHFA